MAEISVENKTCKACGADIRSGALFCYSCGEPLQSEKLENATNIRKNVGDASFREDLKEEKNGNKSQQNERMTTRLKEVAETPPIPKPNVAAETKLKSAAAMRRKTKIYQPKKIEVIWEEHENAPNGWFILVTIALTLLAAGIFYLAIYLK